MKSGKFTKITDDMIGVDDKICSCSSVVGDIILFHETVKKKKNSLKKIAKSLRRDGRLLLTEGTKQGKGKKKA
jgi:hypothetical protein